MPQYGDWIAQSAPIAEEVMRPVLAEQAANVVAHLGLGETPIEFAFNLPYAIEDEETGEVVHGFQSSWKITVP